MLLLRLLDFKKKRKPKSKKVELLKPKFSPRRALHLAYPELYLFSAFYPQKGTGRLAPTAPAAWRRSGTP
jgi:hypothetical protein